MLRIIAFFTALSVIGGCASQGPTSEALLEPHPPVIDANYLLSGHALLGHSVAPAEYPDDDLLAVSLEMAAFLAELSPGASPEDRWQALLSYFTGDQFGVEYDALTTLSAADTFDKKTGNCLAVTLLMISLARELGVNAYFNQVQIPRNSVVKDAQTVINFRHINMVAEVGDDRTVVDFGWDDYDASAYQHWISDRQAFAQYYSNRAIEVMQSQGNVAESFGLMRKALSLAPGDSNIWSNLGAMYSRYGEASAAEQAYLQAFQLDSSDIFVLSSLERFYRETGQPQRAVQYENELQAQIAQHPQTLFYEAQDLYAKGQYRASKSRLTRALTRSKDDHRLHFLLGKTQFQLGDYNKAKTHLTEAFSLLDDPTVKLTYEQQLSELQNKKKM